jgi:hypothetical protein
MMYPPAYFEQVRSSASNRWDQLERDPDLAGPWHQLFKQVQSPRHVVSELLQNADDAGATMATVEILDGDFVFTHNGEDFIEEHFMSLCRFGYSNKVALHTIGFRGIGFKSTFSIGDEVRLKTPSLSVVFRRNRFTEPVWIPAPRMSEFYTEFRVKIRDQYRLDELKKNLHDWTKSPGSLLFFRSIRCLSVQGREIQWEKVSDGPVPDSQWMILAGDPDRPYLHIQSLPEDFPEEALSEIRQERMITIDNETFFPPSKVEIVLGLEGRLFVILPTGIKTTLPFACNAPFIQDPARVKIKDPDISFTNRWLLNRIGKLCAQSLLAWLNRTDLSMRERSKAYSLIPELDDDNNSIAGYCNRIIERTCRANLTNREFLLTENETLAREKYCLSVPDILFEIWPSEQVCRSFSKNGLPVLSRHVRSIHRKRLLKWHCLKELDREEVLKQLKSEHLPKPEPWIQLLFLWEYVAKDLNQRYRYLINPEHLNIFPVKGRIDLFSANKIVRLSDKKLLPSLEDWQFVSDYLLLLDQNWLKFLSDQGRQAQQDVDHDLLVKIESAYQLLSVLKLDQSSDVSQVINQVSKAFFANEENEIKDCIRLAHLAASLGAAVSEKFQFVTCDEYLTPVDENVIADLYNDLDMYVPENWYQAHVLHPDYNDPESYSKETWRQWIMSGRSGVLTFVPFDRIERNLWNREKIKQLLKERGAESDPSFHYKGDNFKIEDWDFEEELWQHWHKSAETDADFWGKLFTRILSQPSEYWKKALTANVWHKGNIYKKSITDENLLPAWIIKFRRLQCLQDTRGRYRHPAELLRRTPDTEYLLEMEPFVRADLDTETVRPLLEMLGVRDTPTGSPQLLGRLKNLATVSNPPIYELEKWYHRIEQMLARCSTEEFQEVKQVFSREKLILTADNQWATTTEVFLHADEEDAPGAAVVHPSFQHQILWHKLGVAERPTSELSLKWLNSIETNKKLSKDELRRVRALIPRYPERIWLECGHWLNLNGEWVPTDHLIFKLTMQTLLPWRNLFESVKQQTADLQKLTADICDKEPFAELSSLSACIEERSRTRINLSRKSKFLPWMETLGRGITRIAMEEESEQKRIQELGHRLANTQWQPVSRLETTPYIDGTPSGQPRQLDVLWQENHLYVKHESLAKMAKPITRELGHVFGRPEITDAIQICFNHEPDFIDEYLEENFRLLDTEAQWPDEVKENNISFNNEKEMPGKIDDDTLLTPEPKPEPTDKSPEKTEPSKINLEPVVSDNADPEKTPPSDLPSPERPSKPKLMERFAKKVGLKKIDGTGKFCFENDSWIERITGDPFPWKQYTATGSLERCYWAKDHCIEQKPLEIPAEVWELCLKKPDQYFILLTDPEGGPVIYTGIKMQSLEEQGRLKLFPAKYRIVFEKQDGEPHIHA